MIKFLTVANALEKRIEQCNLDPSTCVLRHVTRTSRMIASAFDEAFAPLGLTSRQFNLLMTLARLGPMNVSGLAAAVGMHPSTTPRLLAPLKRSGLLGSKPGADRRESLIAITPKGMARLNQAFSRWAKLQQKLVSQVGAEEWSSTMANLGKIRKALSSFPELH